MSGGEERIGGASERRVKTSPLVELLAELRSVVLAHATDALGRARLAHYEAVGTATSRRRLSNLLAIVTRCLLERDLGPITVFAEAVAEDRYAAGFDIAEVQVAFNVLEEAIWRVVLPRLPVEQLADAAGLTGTILGAGKDTLARTWVSLATRHHAPSLDLAALFEGAGA
ncbi:MAG TPA: hypothetical protein VMD59_12000 [Acidimicrobiales bacterium]|nr:hypothetical protein [Acidimicrobiales bacterium]